MSVLIFIRQNSNRVRQIAGCERTINVLHAKETKPRAFHKSSRTKPAFAKNTVAPLRPRGDAGISHAALATNAPSKVFATRCQVWNVAAHRITALRCMEAITSVPAERAMLVCRHWQAILSFGPNDCGSLSQRHQP